MLGTHEDESTQLSPSRQMAMEKVRGAPRHPSICTVLPGLSFPGTDTAHLRNCTEEIRFPPQNQEPTWLGQPFTSPCHWEKLCRHQEEAQSSQPGDGPIPHSPAPKTISVLSHRVPSCTSPAQLPFGALAAAQIHQPTPPGRFQTFTNCFGTSQVHFGALVMERRKHPEQG